MTLSRCRSPPGAQILSLKQKFVTISRTINFQCKRRQLLIKRIKRSSSRLIGSLYWFCLFRFRAVPFWKIYCEPSRKQIVRGVVPAHVRLRISGKGKEKKIYKCSRYFHICADVESIMLYTEAAGFLARKENIDRNQLHSDRKKKETGRNVCS